MITNESNEMVLIMVDKFVTSADGKSEAAFRKLMNDPLPVFATIRIVNLFQITVTLFILLHSHILRAIAAFGTFDVRSKESRKYYYYAITITFQLI